MSVKEAVVNVVKPERASALEPLLRRAPGVVLGLAGLAVMGGSWRLGLTQDGSMGPGLWPFMAAVLLVVSSVGIVLGPVEERDAEDDATFFPPAAIAAIVAMAAFAALLTTIGITTSIALVSLFWLKVLAGEKWLLSVVMSLVLAIVIYFLFIQVLDIPLPVDAFLPR